RAWAREQRAPGGVNKDIRGGLARPADVRDVEWPQRVVLREAMLVRLDQPGRGDRSRDERDPNGLERRRRQRLRGQARPETVPVAGHGDETGEPAVAYGIVDLGALAVRGAVVAATAEARVALARPARACAGGQVLGIRAPVQRALRVPPDLPGRPRRGQPLQEPGLLLGAEDGLRRLMPAEVGDLCAPERQGFRGAP